MAYTEKEIKRITNQVLEEFIAIESDFGMEVSEEETRAIKFAVASTLTKSIPF